MAVPRHDLGSRQAWLLALLRHPPAECTAHSERRGDQRQVAEAEAGCSVGIRRLTNSATSAIRARTDNDRRSPSRRAVAFSSTMALAVSGGTPGRTPPVVVGS